MRSPRPTRATHPLDISYLVVGLVFLGIAGSWALRTAGVLDTRQVGWVLPLLLVGAGVVGLVASAARGLRSAPQDGTQDGPDGGFGGDLGVGLGIGREDAVHDGSAEGGHDLFHDRAPDHSGSVVVPRTDPPTEVLPVTDPDTDVLPRGDEGPAHSA